MKRFLFALLLLVVPALPAAAAAANVYFDTGGCQSGSTVQCSGTTDSASSTVSSASATITCSSVAGPAGLTGCSLSGTPSLAGIAVDGSQAIYVDCATNSDQKIFFINAIDDALDLVGTTVAPTGCTTATSAWGIGGRMIYNSAYWESAPRAGDTFWFNDSPASKTTDFITTRVSGGTTLGFISVKGKAGVRPKLTVTNTNQCIESNSPNWWFENLECEQQGASGSVIVTGGASDGTIFYNMKVSDGGGSGIAIISGGSFISVINSEISGVLVDGVSIGATADPVISSYIHDNGGDGIEITALAAQIMVNYTILDSNAGRGLYLSGAATGSNQNIFLNSVIYGSGNSGLEVTDADTGVTISNSIFLNNGDAAGEYNVEWVAGSIEANSWHGYNDFSTAGTGGSGNVFGLTVNATEITTDPLFADAPNGNFSIGSTSPAKATGFPGTMLGGTNVGYMDMGALQVQATGGGARGLIIGQ